MPLYSYAVSYYDRLIDGELVARGPRAALRSAIAIARKRARELVGNRSDYVGVSVAPLDRRGAAERVVRAEVLVHPAAPDCTGARHQWRYVESSAGIGEALYVTHQCIRCDYLRVKVTRGFIDHDGTPFSGVRYEDDEA